MYWPREVSKRRTKASLPKRCTTKTKMMKKINHVTKEKKIEMIYYLHDKEETTEESEPSQ